MRITSPHFYFGLSLAFFCLAVSPLFTGEEVVEPEALEDVWLCGMSKTPPPPPAPAAAPTLPTEEYPIFCSLPREEMPLFPGCEELEKYVDRKQCADKKLLEFIYGNITYPPQLRESTVEGTVVITFHIEADGLVSNPKIVRDIGGGCGKEALRVVQLMVDQNIRWTPGIFMGEPTRVQFNLPVKFKLE